MFSKLTIKTPPQVTSVWCEHIQLVYLEFLSITGPTKLRSYEISSVPLTRVFLWYYSQERFDFSDEIRASSNLDSDGARFFYKKSYYGVFGPKCPKMRFLKFYEISTHAIFLVFYVKLQQLKV